MRVLICFDKFKDSMSAQQAGAIVQASLQEAHPADIATETVALADGGDGFCEILTQVQGGALETHTVSGSLRQPVQAQLGWVNGSELGEQTLAHLNLGKKSRIAIIEMAQATGLQSLPPAQRDCWKTTSLGTGELIRMAGERGADHILLGVGGSSTNDLGLGALEALGLSFRDRNSKPLRPIRPELWPSVDHIEGNLPPNLPSITVACDVQNPLFGPQGAAVIYGPQKGLKARDFERMESLGKKLARLLCQHMAQPWDLTEVPGSGAAGGITFGLATAGRVQLMPGFDLVSNWLDLPSRLDRCDWLITGEGKFDLSSLQGKGPGTLAKQALALGKRVSILAGKIEVTADAFPGQDHNLDLLEISPRDIPLPLALAREPQNLRRAVAKGFGLIQRGAK